MLISKPDLRLPILPQLDLTRLLLDLQLRLDGLPDILVIHYLTDITAHYGLSCLGGDNCAARDNGSREDRDQSTVDRIDQSITGIVLCGGSSHLPSWELRDR